MPLSTADLEGCVESLYRLAECEEDEVLTPSSLAEQLFGARCVQRVPRMIEAGALARAGDRRFIGVRASLRGPAAEHVIGHELGHYALNLERYTGDDTERCCDYIGAAIMTRRRPFARSAAGRERDFAALASDWETTETMVALRVGEVMGLPVAVVTPQQVRARGGEWPDERRLRELARTGGPGLARVRLTDDRRRVALIGEEDIDAA